MKTEILKALTKIQKELNVPKGRYNAFAKFNYRSCEDILEGIKKVLPDNASVIITDDIVMIGDRHYVKATATFMLGDLFISANGFAREPVLKKGSDESQITGGSSSYARKYALNALFLIDDAKDIDEEDNTKHSSLATTAQLNQLNKFMIALDVDHVKQSEWLKRENVNSFPQMESSVMMKYLDMCKKEAEKRNVKV